MSGPTWYFHYQQIGGEDKWVLDLASRRAEVTATLKPTFVTVLDLSSVPSDNDWTKVRYQGPLYFDFDADGDLDLACTQFKHFILKISDQLGFDISQARLYASGGKGFHIEIPAECFMPKVPPTGTPWLPYVYRQIAESLIVDTLDLRVYTGKRGRMWRTPNVQRESGKYKVSLSLADAMAVTPDLYAELVSAPREQELTAPASFNVQFGMLFERSKDKIITQMRGKKKRQAVANAFLDPWKAAKRTPPTIEGLMDGTLVAEGVGFQNLAMQLAIYANSVNMELAEFLDRCKGVCESHVSDSRRYGSPAKRQEELARMFRYMMEDNTLYDFAIGPLKVLVKRGTPMPDLGVMETEDHGDVPTPPPTPPSTDTEDEAATALPIDTDPHRGMRKGFFMNAEGMWKRTGEITEAVCRATLRNVEAFHDVDSEQFLGYEFDIVQKGVKTFRTMLGADGFTSATLMKRFFVNHQISFQGGDFEVMSLQDVMSEKAKRGGKIYTFPREGFMVINNPHTETKDLVKVYLTKSTFISSLPEDHPDYFKLRYRPTQTMSSYNIDIHRAPDLDVSMIPALHDLFSFTRDDVGARLLGWFTSSHFRSVYLELFSQFPILQLWGEAGAGKSQTILMLSHFHWYMNSISVKSAVGATPFAVDSNASSSTSAPYIIDEFKPREMKVARKGSYEKLKDMFKLSYNGSDLGERGTVNKGPESSLAVIRNKASAPVIFMGEAIEMEAAIMERSVTLNLTKAYQTKQRTAAFERLRDNPTAISALGKAIMMSGFSLNMEKMRAEVTAIRAEIEDRLPPIEDDSMRRAAPRMIFNQAVVVHGLRVLKHVLHQAFGTEFDASIDAYIVTCIAAPTEDNKADLLQNMSEVSRVINRIALLSREQDTMYQMAINRDYIVGEGWVEVKVEKAYDQYRLYCAKIHDTPLFDSLEAFLYALNAYSPCTDRSCANSLLREDGSSERIVRLSIKKLNKEGVQSFRT
jgi:hypothetical protein